MDIENQYYIERTNVRLSFNKAAKDYDENAVLQKTIFLRLIETFDHLNLVPNTILDLGSGTGQGTKVLRSKFKKAKLYSFDLSEEMLKLSKKRNKTILRKNYFLCGEASQLPFKDETFDLIFSNLMLQWCSSIETVFKEARRILKPNGLFVFSSFGPDTLKELRASWKNIDQFSHTNLFVDMHDIGDALSRNNYEAPVLSTEHVVLTYDDCLKMMRDLKSIGAKNVTEGRRKTLTGKQRINKVIEHYEQFRAGGKLPVTYEVIYGHAWCPEKNRHNNSINGITSVPLSKIKEAIQLKK